MYVIILPFTQTNETLKHHEPLITMHSHINQKIQPPNLLILMTLSTRNVVVTRLLIIIIF